MGKGEDPWKAYRMDEVERSIGKKDRDAHAIVLIQEGEKCVEYARNNLLLPSITWAGSSWKNDREIRNTAISFREMRLVGLFLPDFDQAGAGKGEAVRQIFAEEGVWVGILDPEILAGCPLEKADDLVQIVEKIKEQAKVGEKDWGELFVERFNTSVVEATQRAKTVRENLEEVVKNSPENTDQVGGHPEVPYRPPGAKRLAEQIAEDVEQYLKWDLKRSCWWQYDRNKFIWEVVDEFDIYEMITREGDRLGCALTANFLKNTALFLKVLCRIKELSTDLDLIPFENGVFSTRSNKFLPHSPFNFLIWKHPFPFTPFEGKKKEDLISECQPIWDWMIESVGKTPEDDSLVYPLVAFLSAVLRRQTYLQRFLECIGPARSGKGTFIRLAEACVGRRRTSSTSFKSLEEGSFEIGKVLDAHLSVISDAERWAGEGTTFKSIIGEDNTPRSRKYVQSEVGESAPAVGMIIVAGEQSPGAGDSGGIDKRRLTIPFLKPVAEERRRNLIKINHAGQIEGEFAPYVSAFISLCLSFSDEEIRKYVLETSKTVPRIAEIKAQALIESDPLANFLDRCCYWSDEVDRNGIARLKTPMGSALTKEEDELSPKRLYPLYRLFCLNEGYKPIAGNTFGRNLENFLNNHLGLKVKRVRHTDGTTYMHHLGIRHQGLEAPAIITDLYAKGLQQPEPESSEKEIETDKSTIASSDRSSEELSGNFELPQGNSNPYVGGTLSTLLTFSEDRENLTDTNGHEISFSDDRCFGDSGVYEAESSESFSSSATEGFSVNQSSSELEIVDQEWGESMPIAYTGGDIKVGSLVLIKGAAQWIRAYNGVISTTLPSKSVPYFLFSKDSIPVSEMSQNLVNDFYRPLRVLRISKDGTMLQLISPRSQRISLFSVDDICDVMPEERG
ncbi:hypothetical protein K9N68_37660 (plasmid) [Kovacikia minuta CCNUW1]|uniref:primase-like DNA-binding domain-containing protein n=1 Tax=Kovacikia minuta TaxID=2931930 RepID=UPI001CCCFDD2|nr:primase-like DNA-binding domain-containing protein [Kovacikia minuta]UBF29941.1 hypothetical protein K9N68_37660 [Kovacikia minuta CCNUW1]